MEIKSTTRIVPSRESRVDIKVRYCRMKALALSLETGKDFRESDGRVNRKTDAESVPLQKGLSAVVHRSAKILQIGRAHV